MRSCWNKCHLPCDGDITSTILQTMTERDEPQLKETWGRFIAPGLVLLYLGKLCYTFYYLSFELSDNMNLMNKYS